MEARIRVHTDGGPPFDLPDGSTPIDLAYAIHTTVGHSAVGARVNGQLAPLYSRLEDGDRVEVITSNFNAVPAREWLALVVTSRARRAISHELGRRAREDLEASGRRQVTTAALEAGIDRVERFLRSSQFVQRVRELRFHSARDFYVAVATGRCSEHQVASLLGELAAAIGTKPGHEFKDQAAFGLVLSEVNGQERPDMLVRLARCCRPVTGDPIVAYISLGRGITIHLKACPNALALSRHPERFLEVRWLEATDEPIETFGVEIAIHASSDTDVVTAVKDVASDLALSLRSLEGDIDDDLSRYSFTLEGIDKQVLPQVLRRLARVPGVFDAYRVLPR